MVFLILFLLFCSSSRVQYTDVWVETKRFYEDSLANVFAKIGKAAPKGKYHKDIQECFKTAEQARKNEAERVQVDESVVKKDLVAGSMASMLSVSVGSLRDAPPDQSSCVPCREVRMKPFDAFYCSWMGTFRSVISPVA